MLEAYGRSSATNYERLYGVKILGFELNTATDSSSSYLMGWRGEVNTTDGIVSFSETFQGVHRFNFETWHKYAVHISSTEATLYVDGVALGHISLTSLLGKTPIVQYDDLEFEAGDIDEVFIHEGLFGTELQDAPYSL